MDRIAASADPNDALNQFAHDALGALQGQSDIPLLDGLKPAADSQHGSHPRQISQMGMEFANWVMDNADQHSRNGVLSVNELRTFLPDHPFTDWLTRDRGTLIRSVVTTLCK